LKIYNRLDSLHFQLQNDLCQVNTLYFGYCSIAKLFKDFLSEETKAFSAAFSTRATSTLVSLGLRDRQRLQKSQLSRIKNSNNPLFCIARYTEQGIPLAFQIQWFLAAIWSSHTPNPRLQTPTFKTTINYQKLICVSNLQNSAALYFVPYLMPEMVTEVSAIFVANINFRTPAGAGRKASSCSSGGSAAYNGRIS